LPKSHVTDDLDLFAMKTLWPGQELHE